MNAIKSLCLGVCAVLGIACYALAVMAVTAFNTLILGKDAEEQLGK